MKKRKCNHSYLDKLKVKYKMGLGVYRCSACGKRIVKGKNTPDKAFGL